jgi:hypothetical protein
MTLGRILLLLALVTTLPTLIKALDDAIKVAEFHRHAWEKIYDFAGCHLLVAGDLNLEVAHSILLARGHGVEEANEYYEKAKVEWHENHAEWEPICQDQAFSEVIYYEESKDVEPKNPNWRFKPH